MAAGGKSTSCGVCNKNVLKKHCAVLCGGVCKFWYHIECINISVDDYENLKGVLPIQGVNWFCQACSLPAETDTNLVALQVKIDKLVDIVKGLVSDNLLINEKFDKVISEVYTATSSAGRRPNLVNHKTNPRTVSVSEDLVSDSISLPLDERDNTGKSYSSALKSGPSPKPDTVPTPSSIGVPGRRDFDSKTNRPRPHLNQPVNAKSIKKRNNTVITGSSHSKSSTLAIVQRNKFLFLSRLKPEVSKEEVEGFLEASDIQNFSVEKLNTKHPSYSSFKVGVSESQWDTVFKETFWPSGVLVGRFFTPKTKRNLNEKAAQGDSGG